MKRSKCLSLLLALALIFSLALPALAAEEGGATVSRGEFVTELYILSGEGTEAAQEAFADVPAEGDLARAVRWAAETGVVNGYGNGNFGPDDPVTWEQMAAMLYRCAQALGQAPEGDWLFPLGFRDAQEISPWADQAVQWAVMNRILTGEGGVFAPKAAAARAGLSDVLARWRDFLKEADGRGVMILYTSDVHCAWWTTATASRARASAP